METISLIRLPLWNRAEWAGTAFLWTESKQSPPVLALAFRNGDVGKEIFDHWRKELGKVDNERRLRLTIIRGINKQNVHAYRVMVGSNPEASGSIASSKLLFMMSRIHTMEPSSDRNLSAFLANYTATNSFFFAPAALQHDSVQPEVFLENPILKYDLHVRQAWEIGRNDPDVMGLREDDDPIIPEGQRDAPANEAIQWLQQCSHAFDRRPDSEATSSD